EGQWCSSTVGAPSPRSGSFNFLRRGDFARRRGDLVALGDEGVGVHADFLRLPVGLGREVTNGLDARRRDVVLQVAADVLQVRHVRLERVARLLQLTLDVAEALL